jgi:ATP/maltotriose-dependent transcriptional regulator MalT
MEADLDNVRAAWRWAVEQGRLDYLFSAISALAHFGQYRGRYLESAELLQQAVDRLTGLPEDEQLLRLRARLLVDVGWFAIRLGRLKQAKEALEACYALCDAGFGPAPGWSTDPSTALAILATVNGDYDEAERYGQISLDRSIALANPWNEGVACYALTRAHWLRGRNSEAAEYARRAHDVATRIRDRWFLAYCLIELGNVAIVEEKLDTAARYYQTSYDLREEFDDPEGMGLALVYLGEVAEQQGRLADAMALYEQSQALYQGINDVGGLAAATTGAARAAMRLGQDQRACRLYDEALQLNQSIGFVPQVLCVLTGVAELLLLRGRTAEGQSLLAYLGAHPALDDEARGWHRRIAGQFGPPGNEAASPAALQAIAEEVFERPLTDVFMLLGASSARPGHARHEEIEHRPDGLTERELEVLRLIARGKSNREIADELFISTNTAANHVKNILSKTGAANRAEATAYAGNHSLL